LDHAKPERLSLFSPGPVTIPPFVLEALGRPLIHHRSPSFGAVYDDVTDKLRALLETDAPVALLASSGTGAMDAVVACLFASGDEVLVPVMGKFSARWVEICRTYGVKAHVIEVEPGRSPAPEDIRREAGRHEAVAGVLLTHCETSTGALTDLEGVARALAGLEAGGRRILTVADCVSSFCVDEVRMDAWGLDCVITASQKGLLSPAGLSIVAVGGRARAAMERVPPRTYYLDLRRYLARAALSSTPFTPALSLLYAVGAAIDRIIEVGLEDVLDWQRRAARAVVQAVEAAGFRPLAEKQSSAVIAFDVGGADAEDVCAVMEEEHGIYMARGQGDLHGRVLRVSPIGKTRGEIVEFAGALLDASAGAPGAGGGLRARIPAALAEVEAALGGRDIWA